MVTGRYKLLMSNNKVGIFNVINNRLEMCLHGKQMPSTCKVLGHIPNTDKYQNQQYHINIFET